MQLKKNQVNNNITLTLKEKTTIDDPVYLFRFESDQTKVKLLLYLSRFSHNGTKRKIQFI